MKDNYLDDIKQIKEIMQQSSRFISLSGMAGIANGLAAITGGYLAHELILKNTNLLSIERQFPTSDALILLIAIALGTIIIAAGSSIYFTNRKTRKNSEPVWDHQTRRMIYSLLIPLVTGGLTCLILIAKGFIGITPSLTLIFYGLALFTASKFTSGDIRNLGLIDIALGLAALYWVSYGLVFWVIGFGALHIIYGIILQTKDRS